LQTPFSERAYSPRFSSPFDPPSSLDPDACASGESKTYLSFCRLTTTLMFTISARRYMSLSPASSRKRASLSLLLSPFRSLFLRFAMISWPCARTTHHDRRLFPFFSTFTTHLLFGFHPDHAPLPFFPPLFYFVTGLRLLLFPPSTNEGRLILSVTLALLSQGPVTSFDPLSDEPCWRGLFSANDNLRNTKEPRALFHPLPIDPSAHVPLYRHLLVTPQGSLRIRQDKNSRLSLPPSPPLPPASIL